MFGNGHLVWVNRSYVFLLIEYADSDVEGVHALSWLCKKSRETYLKVGR